MAPKKGAKGKKGKDDDSDAHWDAIAAKSASAAATPASATPEEEESTPARNNAKSFSSLSYDDVLAAGEDDEGDSLMDAIAKQSTKKGKKPKRNAIVIEEEDDSTDPPPSKEVEVVAADDWMEAEFGGEKEKKGKGKKGKKGGKKVVEEDDEETEEVTKGAEAIEIAPSAATETVAVEEDDADEPEEAGSKVLSKKEKEKAKKEKEKLKKKAQAAAKKQNAATTDEPSAPAPVVAAPDVTPVAAPVEDVDDAEEGEETGAGGKDKKKKKKKAAAKKEEPAPKKGGASGQMAALRALVEAQKAAAEETERLVREHKQKIEDEEKRIEEEERLAAEEKAKRKEKERAKREQQKKEGKLLTPKQKAERAAAEIRLKALVADSGNTIVGLQEQAAGEGDDQPKKVSYAKKKPFNKKPVVAAAETKVEEVPVIEEVKEAEKVQEDDADVKDDWDASDDEEEVKAESVKDSWDASESEEEKPVPVAVAAPVKAAVVEPVKATNGKAVPPKVVKSVPKAAAKPVVKAAPVKPAAFVKPPPGSKNAAIKPVQRERGPLPKPGAKGAKFVPPPVESSSEEESEEESGSDDSDDDSEEDSDDDSSEDEEGLTHTQRVLIQKKAEAKERRMKKEAEALAARSKDNMRSPICVILGHVDTGKTKLLDKIRQTNVQEGEAGGITQQIGATYFPMDIIRTKTAVLGEADLKKYMLPGLLVIDTPGHESFTNLRTRGSSLCNIAILVVDIMHGLEPQTLESLRLLRDGKTPFIVALNKIDRLYGWKAIPDGGFEASLAAQQESVRREYKERLDQTVLAFAEQGLNSLPYYENKDFGRIVSLVPTSAHTGEGVPDMLMLIVKLTQEKMTERLMYLSTLEATVLEVKVIEGLGTTIDVVLSNGVLHEGDRIVICGLNGAIVTTIRALLTPQPLKELRIKGSYVHHKSVKASLGIKIVAPDLEKAIAGSRLLVLGEDDDEDELREEIMSDLTDLMNSVDKSGRGVCVQASTLGSLEALLEFLKTSKIPVSGINIGPVHRKDVMRSASMLEKAKELAVILAFDVPVDKEAEKLADELGIKIFKADIIYHLFDAFSAYNAAIVEQKRVDSAPKAVWPVKLKIIACFAKRDPIILGCDIIDGSLRVGTPLCVVRVDPETKKKDIISLGKITSLEINHKVQDVIKKHQAGGGVAVKIEHASYESAKQYGRHFDDKDEIIAMVSRVSIDTLKTHFREDVSKEDWQLIVQLKNKLDVV